LLNFQKFSPFGITTFTAFAVLQGVRGNRLQLHALRPRPPRLAWLAGELATAAKSAIADFRFKVIGVT